MAGQIPDDASGDAVKAIDPFAHGRSGALARGATYASVSVALFLVILKLAAWFMTDSVAILASLVDSMLDGFASIVTLIAVRRAYTPADAEHRFGHGKAEPLAALAQSMFITGSAVLLLFEAVRRFISPQPVAATEIGLGVMGVSIVATLGLVAFQRYVIARSDSVAIKADSLHYKADLFANLGVIAALVASGYLGWQMADPLLAVVIGVYILWSAKGLAMDALNMLMDRELPDEDRARIREIALSYPDVMAIHDMRSRRSGPYRFIQMHLEMNGALSLNRAHSVADAVEKQIMDEFPGSEVIVHQDPATPQGATGRPAGV